MRTKVSVIIPSFNSYEYTKRAIESVINQSEKSIEILITDDWSSDGTYEKLKKQFNKTSEVKIFQLPQNMGPAHARNNSIKYSNGRFIAFLDSDDVWYEDKLSIQLAFMEKHRVPFSYTAYQTVDDKGNLIRGKINVPNTLSYNDLLRTCDIYCSTVIYDTNYFGKVLMPKIRKRQDYGLWLKLLKKTDLAYGINEVLMRYQLTSNSVSRNKFKAAKFQFNVYYNIEKLGFFKSIYYIVIYAFYGVLKTYFGKTRKL